LHISKIVLTKPRNDTRLTINGDAMEDYGEMPGALARDARGERKHRDEREL